MSPDSHAVTMAWVGDRHLRLSLGEGTSLAMHRRVRGAFERLCRASLPGLRDITPAYATILLSFDLATLDTGAVETAVARAVHGLDGEDDSAPSRLVEIPVCYEGECAPDMGEVAALHGLNEKEVAALHSGAEYVVHFLGFSPGFPYLGGLPARLATARLEKPRTRVPIGSVGIAGDQTGIYPQATPGGWRLIGRTPLRLFDPAREPPSLLAMGDRVRFISIGVNEFNATLQGGA